MKEWFILGLLCTAVKICMVFREPQMTYAYKQVKYNIQEKYAFKSR